MSRRTAGSAAATRCRPSIGHVFLRFFESSILRRRPSVRCRVTTVDTSQRDSEGSPILVEHSMFTSIRIIGRGRVGSAIAARLSERGHQLVDQGADLVLLCVPDAAIGEVAQSITSGPWVAHTSGATPLAALAPHTQTFGVHPLQTIVPGRGPEQLDGASAAVTGEDEH